MRSGDDLKWNRVIPAAEKMADWYWTKQEFAECTPSRKDGIALEEEKRYRKDGARLIILCSTSLGLLPDTQATGVVFFHRFFMFQSFKQFDRWVVAAASLLLAGKVEETPKKCKDILKTVRGQLTDAQFAKFGQDPKEELLTHERILLQTIKFDLMVEKPYQYILSFGKKLISQAGKNSKLPEMEQEKQGKLRTLMQMAWTFINDSLCTTLSLHWEPQTIAVAFLYLAAKLSKTSIHTLCGTRKSWWRQFVDTVDEHDLEDICHDLLNLYNDQDQDVVATKEAPPKQAVSAAPPSSSETMPHTLASSASLPPVTFADMHAQPSDQQQPNPPPLPPPLVPPPTHQLPHPVPSTAGLPLTTTTTTSAGGNTTRKIPSAYEVAANYARQRQQRQSGGLPFVYPGVPGAPNNPALFQNQGMSHRGIPQGTPSGTASLQPSATQISQVGLGLMGNSSYLTSLPEHARAAIASGIPPPPLPANLQLPHQKAMPGVPQSFHQSGATGYTMAAQGQVPGQAFPATAMPTHFMHALPPDYRTGHGRN